MMPWDVTKIGNLRVTSQRYKQFYIVAAPFDLQDSFRYAQAIVKVTAHSIWLHISMKTIIVHWYARNSNANGTYRDQKTAGTYS